MADGSIPVAIRKAISDFKQKNGLHESTDDE